MSIPKINQDLDQIKKNIGEADLQSPWNDELFDDEAFDHKFSKDLNMSHPYRDEGKRLTWYISNKLVVREEVNITKNSDADLSKINNSTHYLRKDDIC